MLGRKNPQADQPQTDTLDTPDPEQASQLTRTQVAKLVKRPAKAGKKEIALKADEVLAFTEYAEHVVVVTTDGQKLTGAKP